MSTATDDTDARSQEVLAAMYRNMSPEQKLRIVRDLTETVSRLALAGLQERHPGEDDGALLLRLARLRFGERLVAEVYPVPPSTP